MTEDDFRARVAGATEREIIREALLIIRERDEKILCVIDAAIVSPTDRPEAIRKTIMDAVLKALGR